MFVPGPLESNSWVHDSQADARDDDHGTLENHESWFIVGEEVTVEAARELNNAVHGTDEDGDGGDGKANKEGLEQASVDDGEVALIPRPPCLPNSQSKFDSGNCETNERDGLENKAAHHDVPAEVLIFLCVGFTGDTSTYCLEYQTDEIAGAEKYRVGAWLEAGKAFPIC